MQRIPLEAPVLAKNDEAARFNQSRFAELGIVAVNLMSAPGAGKTSVLEETLRRAGSQLHAAVVEGDLQTDLDSRRIQALGVPAFQITTGTVCHLDARMVARALADFPLDGRDVLFIENVGNLVCPAEFDLGEHLRVMVYSVVEGADKPQKYPLMFHQAHAILLNKVDLLPYAGIPLEELWRNVREVNPNAAVFPLSCRTGEGFEPWMAWLAQAVAQRRPAPVAGKES